MQTKNPTLTRRANVTLWIIQALLAALFIFAGAMKLVTPLDQMQGPVSLPGSFLRFIGVAELLGGLGLVLPGLFRIHRELTPLAALALTPIMLGAVVISALASPAGALVPLVVGALCATIAWTRRPRTPTLSPLAGAR